MDNTLVIYVMGDNGASAEGLQGTTNEVATAGNGVKEDLPFLLSHHGRVWRADHLQPLSGGLGACNGYAVAVDKASRIPFWRYA